MGDPSRPTPRPSARFEGNLPTFAGLVGTPDQIVERLRQYQAVGSQEVYFSMRDAHELESIKLFGETVIPALADT